MAYQQFTPEELKSEEWRNVPGYEGVYMVSNLGRIMRVMNPSMSQNGYSRVELNSNGIHERVAVHRLVAAAFIGQRPGGYEVNHLNGSRGDNRANNLEYCTPQENVAHSINVLGNRRDGENNARSKLTSQQVLEIRELHASGVSQKSLAKRYGVRLYTVQRIVHGAGWKHI